KNWDEGSDDFDPAEFEITYVDMARQSFEKHPDNVALIYLGVKITFRDLDRCCNRFANMLLENGFEKGDVVGINLPNIPENVIAMVGTLRAGCIISGVSPLLSADQIKYQLNDLGSTGKKVGLVTLDAIFAARVKEIAAEIPRLKLVVAASVAGFLPGLKRMLGKLLKKIPTGKVTPLPGKVVLNFQKDVLTRYSAEEQKVHLTPDDPGWIQYTGGTTGDPKGAVLSHRNLASNILSITKWLGGKKGTDILLSAFPIFHLAGMTVAISGLYMGWTQILTPNPRDTDHISEEIKHRKPNILANVPTLYQMLMANPKFRSLDHSTLKSCISGAAPFPKESQAELEEIIGKGKLLEVYGMTETSPVSCMNPALGKKKLGSVGMPFFNTDVKIVDPFNGEEVPIGEAGEILVKGPLVMQGYHNRPEETRNVLDEEGYMHTGDVGVMDEDGYIRIVDRTKDMIIVGGFKVFSSKVEDVISAHPAIAMMALIGIDNPEKPGSEFVKACIQRNPDHDFDGDEKALKRDILAFA
ncbi:MAG: long-chain fatty acid--CoA ligase, partial [Desulfobacterales bacterium]|nr:long-chain fatty acid--CoA ligase [Desulfobacterales bacterium]